MILSNTFRTGIVGLSKTLASELAPYNILINTIAPGRIATDRVNHLDQVNADKLGVDRETIALKAKEGIPLKDMELLRNLQMLPLSYYLMLIPI